MDFGWAIEQLKNGKKVRRASWGTGKPGDEQHIKQRDRHLIRADGVVFDLEYFQVLADDWELYEEDDWNWVRDGSHTWNDKKYVEKLKEKILEDIENLGAIDLTNHSQAAGAKMMSFKVREILDKRFGF